MSALLGVSLLAGSLPPVKTAPKAAVAQTQAAATTDDSGAYLFVHFIDEEQTVDKEQVYFSVSKNGTSWKTLNGVKPVLDTKSLPGGTGGIRDPHIIRSPEGDKFYMIATDLSIYNLGLQYGGEKWGKSQSEGSQSIVIWESEDLVNWSEPRLRKVGADNAGCVWAPESIWDKEKNAYMVFWASRTKEYWKHCIYRSYTTDFDTFTEPEVYIESDDSRIDTTFYEEDGVYYRFTKNEGDGKKYVYMERGTSLSGDFEVVTTYTLDGKPYDAEGHLPFEGPTVYKLHGQERWCMLLDSFNYRPFETDDISKGRFVSAKAFNFGGTLFRHGTVLPITRAEYDALIDKWEGGEDPIEDDVTTGELVYSLDFEENLNAGAGTVTAEATKHGDPTYVDGVNGGKAIRLSKNNYVQIPGATLAGSKAVTVTFAAKVHDSSLAWLFYASENDAQQSWSPHTEKYLGIGWKVDGHNGIKVQRFNNNGNRPNSAESNGITDIGDWMHVAAVFHVDGIDLYLNGELAATVGSGYKLVDILGEDPVIYLGRANWEGGQYGNSTLDCLKIYNYALSAEAIAALNESDMGDDKYVPPAPLVPPTTQELIYELDFEENLDPTTGSATPVSSSTNPGYEEGYLGKGHAIRLNNNYLTIDAKMLAGCPSLTVSFAAKVSGKSWLFYASPDDSEQHYASEHYLGALFDGGNLSCERYGYYEPADRAPSPSTGGLPTNEWVHITIVYREDTTLIYINGEEKASVNTTVGLVDMLGRKPIIQLGKANWTSNGEYANTLIDCFKIHNYALSADEVTALYNGLQNA